MPFVGSSRILLIILTLVLRGPVESKPWNPWGITPWESRLETPIKASLLLTASASTKPRADSMEQKDRFKDLGLEPGRHYEMRELAVPVVQADLYTTLGRRLFDLYQKYKVESTDQREIEGIVFVLQAFVQSRQRTSIWRRILRLGR